MQRIKYDDLFDLHSTLLRYWGALKLREGCMVEHTESFSGKDKIEVLVVDRAESVAYYTASDTYKWGVYNPVTGTLDV